MINLLLINIIVVIIVDLSGFTDAWLHGLSSWLGREVVSLKPLSCSFCMTTWTSLIYIICTRHFTLIYIAMSLISAYLTPVTSSIILIIRELMLKICRIILTLIQ